MICDQCGNKTFLKQKIYSPKIGVISGVLTVVFITPIFMLQDIKFSNKIVELITNYSVYLLIPLIFIGLLRFFKPRYIAFTCKQCRVGQLKGEGIDPKKDQLMFMAGITGGVLLSSMPLYFILSIISK